MRLESALCAAGTPAKRGRNAQRCGAGRAQDGAGAEPGSPARGSGAACAAADKYTRGLQISLGNIRSTNINEDASH